MNSVVILAIHLITLSNTAKISNEDLHSSLLYSYGQQIQTGKFIGSQQVQYFPASNDVSQKIVSVESIRYTISVNEGVRYEKDYKRFKGGNTRPDIERLDIGVVTNETHKLYTPSVEGGVIFPGDKTTVYNSVERPHLLTAGKPFMAVYDAENIVKVESHRHEEVDVLRVVISKDFNEKGTGLTHEILVSPDIGFKVIRSRQYTNGVLWFEENFGLYQEVIPGYWYPMYQECKTYTAELPKEILQKIQTGELPIHDDLVLSSQTISDIQYSLARQLDHVDLNVPIDVSTFDFRFPYGTTVMDTTRVTENDMPLHYKVGYETAIDLVDLDAVSSPVSRSEKKTELSHNETVTSIVEAERLDDINVLKVQGERARGDEVARNRTKMTLIFVIAGVLMVLAVGVLKKHVEKI